MKKEVKDEVVKQPELTKEDYKKAYESLVKQNEALLVTIKVLKAL